ncbi:CaiB/BaiF CoA-transferase family protein [Aeromicrobium sp. Leaf350]|uniref:CaiB/BaiF CoA transferase family protein n=1 Tax=Aeromicrobium sp. Leaf350 TaxID=2876565 RepID=UPI00210316E3|nr:CaiB/BaiF CoA-transferase family protein [Aeromicrobium sp. Leaf350]
MWSPGGAGPLSGLRVVELAAIGPVPHAGTLLSDLGADVVCVRRRDATKDIQADHTLRGRRIISADLKNPAELEQVKRLIARSDVLLEGFRPGVVERLGLGPTEMLGRHPALVYGRMTGWGQDGPLASTAGHDINYIALTGVLNAVGRQGARPIPPLNLVGDFGGGSMFLLFGVLAALYERQSSGQGQVIDAAMVDGVFALSHLIWNFRAQGRWSDERGTNLLDTGAPFYDTYETSDGLFMAVGALEPQFYREFIRLMGLAGGDLPEQYDRSRWDELRVVFTDTFRGKSRDEWSAVFDGSDACVTPVLSFEEATRHPHVVERGSVVNLGGADQHHPAPRFSRSVAPSPEPARFELSIDAVWS